MNRTPRPIPGSSRQPPRSAAPSGFRYQQRDTSSLQQTQQRYASGGRDSFISADVTTYTPQKGDNWVRILPPTWENAQHYGKEVYVHYGIGPDRSAYLCLEKAGKGHCPICEERNGLMRLGQEEAANELRPTFRVAVYILDRKSNDADPKLWLMPFKIDQELVALAQDKRTGAVLWIDDPDNGYDIEFTRTGEGIKTQYGGIRIARNPTPLGNDAALQFVVDHPLDGIFLYKSEEELSEAVQGTPPPKDDDAGTPARGTPPAREETQQQRPTTRTRSAPASTSKLTPEERFNLALATAEQHNIEIPDSVPDDDLVDFVIKELGDTAHTIPGLV